MFCGYNGIKVASNNRKITEKFLHIWKLNRILLNNSHAKEQVSGSLKKYIELHKNKNSPYLILWDPAKAA